ncbi:MAG: tripartite tricarboxylate transporter substrate binding protein, partial [Burkholderiaceae bacterium]|nr:tripartite tricarboxylate transporter substrate binding protein [Burkholderiaceae bacterium]
MKHKAYVVLHLLFLGLVGANIVSAQTDAYPVRPITMIVPTAPGGTTDISARMLATPLGSALGQTIVVENKGGGNGNIAAAQVKRAPADGYMIMMQYSGYHVITPHVSKQQQWEQKDFQAVANVISAPQIIVIRADLPIKNFKELIAYAKANPGKLNYASSGNGSLQHVTGAMLEQQAGIK